MGKDRIPATPAIRALKQSGASFRVHAYRYEEKGGTALAAKALGLDEHSTVKTIVMEDERREPFLVLMHGDREVSTKAMARLRGVKTVKPCDARTANKHTGYQVGGTSPFGIRRTLPIYFEASIAKLEKIFINAGKRGLLVEMSAADMVKILHPLPVEAAIST